MNFRETNGCVIFKCGDNHFTYHNITVSEMLCKWNWRDFLDCPSDEDKCMTPYLVEDDADDLRRALEKKEEDFWERMDREFPECKKQEDDLKEYNWARSQIHSYEQGGLQKMATDRNWFGHRTDWKALEKFRKIVENYEKKYKGSKKI